MTNYDFPCMDDSPMNNGRYYRDEEEMDDNWGMEAKPFIEDLEFEEITVVNRGDGAMACINDLEAIVGTFLGGEGNIAQND